MLGLGGSARGQQPQMRGGPVPPQQQPNETFNRYSTEIHYSITVLSTSLWICMYTVPGIAFGYMYFLDYSTCTCTCTHYLHVLCLKV